MRLAPDAPELVAIRSKLPEQYWVKELAEEQHLDGSWGRFHSQDSKIKTRFLTSEVAIRRALALGLDKDNPVLSRAIIYMQGVLAGKVIWSDRAEKSEGWQTAVEAISAGTLAQVDPSHPGIDKAWEYWVEISKRSFPSGKYDPEAEWKAHKDLHGNGIRYLRSRYVLALLGARSRDLPQSLDKQISGWIWEEKTGIGYLGTDLHNPQSIHILHWLESHEILSQFQHWRDFAQPAMDWLWRQRVENGRWDFGARVNKCSYFPLSDDWRKEGNRSVDHSTRVLALLREFVD